MISYGLGQFKLDAPNDIKIGEPFQVRFCSAEYDKTSSNKSGLVWGFGGANSGVNGKMVIAEMHANGSSYLFNGVINYPTPLNSSRPTSIGVLEYINDYYVVGHSTLTITGSTFYLFI